MFFVRKSKYEDMRAARDHWKACSADAEARLAEANNLLGRIQDAYASFSREHAWLWLKNTDATIKRAEKKSPHGYKACCNPASNVNATGSSI